MTTKRSFFSRLNKPYYLETLPRKRWLNSLLFATFVFLFLFVFRPFGLNTLQQGILTVSLGYALTTFVIMVLLNVALLSQFPNFFSEERWNVQREIYWNMTNVLLIGLGNALYSSFIGIAPFSPYAILIFELYTISIAVIPVTVTVLIKESRLNNQFGHQSAELNADIEEHAKEIKPTTQAVSLKLVSENEKETLELEVNDLIYVQSSDNYVEVHYMMKDVSSKKLIRSSLKAVTEQLESYPDLFRCHKSYLVNLKRVKHVSGNAQGYKLKLEGGNKLIPVARACSDSLKKKLNN
ncbi:LytTR family DNA-binding domain-containing protein [Aurantibacillus circumpalustris]|uniref:LytTR family DNA-binding domain-containing protein n=1 Tax=Aurantibacillus circumpalustris TaxID=3036359 RepID=UPI00295C0226|nr:LytTR family DNA-binding domain-containing protein [Aurantibacillus circumpalustris]